MDGIEFEVDSQITGLNLCRRARLLEEYLVHLMSMPIRQRRTNGHGMI